MACVLCHTCTRTHTLGTTLALRMTMTSIKYSDIIWEKCISANNSLMSECKPFMFTERRWINKLTSRGPLCYHSQTGSKVYVASYPVGKRTSSGHLSRDKIKNAFDLHSLMLIHSMMLNPSSSFYFTWHTEVTGQRSGCYVHNSNM